MARLLLFAAAIPFIGIASFSYAETPSSPGTNEESDDLLHLPSAHAIEANTVETPIEQAAATEAVTHNHTEEAQNICEATCGAAVDAQTCEAECMNETTFCFQACENLSADADDCFINCTQIAVDFGSQHDESLEAIDRRLPAGADEETTTYGRPFAFGMNAVGGLHFVPNFLLDIFLDRSVSHWEDGAKFFYGGEFVFRFDDKNDFIIGIDWADFRTPDGWWLDKDEPMTSMDWVENDLRALTITLGWNGIAHLDKKKRAHFYGGIGLGAAIRFGNFNKAELTVGCVDANHASDFFDTATPDTYCPNLPSEQMLLNRDSSGHITQWEREKIPPVLPSLLVNAGFRYMIADTVSIAVEGGFKTAAFYGGLKVGFMVGRSHTAIRAQEARELSRVGD